MVAATLRQQAFALAGTLLSAFGLKAKTRLVAQQKPMNMTLNQSENLEKATFGTGCFWCTEALYESLDGVIDAVSG